MADIYRLPRLLWLLTTYPLSRGKVKEKKVGTSQDWSFWKPKKRVGSLETWISLSKELVERLRRVFCSSDSMNENREFVSISECIELGEQTVREKVQQGQRKSPSVEAVLFSRFFFGCELKIETTQHFCLENFFWKRLRVTFDEVIGMRSGDVLELD